MLHFYIPWKHQKTSGFQMFSGGMEIKYWIKMDQNYALLGLVIKLSKLKQSDKALQTRS